MSDKMQSVDIEVAAVALQHYDIDKMPPHVSKRFSWVLGTLEEEKTMYRLRAIVCATAWNLKPVPGEDAKPAWPPVMKEEGR